MVHLRVERLPRPGTPGLAVVTLSRPRGYFDRERDHITLDGMSQPPDVPAGVAGISTATAQVTDRCHRTVAGQFNGEHIAGRAWPLAEGHVVTLELHH